MVNGGDCWHRGKKALINKYLTLGLYVDVPESITFSAR